MTTTVEVKVTDGGSIDATTTKLVKLRDVKKEIESGTGKGGAAAIKSVADAADSGAAKFQKATGALQNFALATGNPIISKSAAMLNGMAMGLAKVSAAGGLATFSMGALASATRGVHVAMNALATHPIMAALIGLAAILASLGAAFFYFNNKIKESAKFGTLAAESTDNLTKSKEDLLRAELSYQALNTPEAAKALADQQVKTAETAAKAAVATLSLVEAEAKSKWSFTNTTDVLKAQNEVLKTNAELVAAARNQWEKAGGIDKSKIAGLSMDSAARDRDISAEEKKLALQKAQGGIASQAQLLSIERIKNAKVDVEYEKKILELKLAGKDLVQQEDKDNNARAIIEAAKTRDAEKGANATERQLSAINASKEGMAKSWEVTQAKLTADEQMLKIATETAKFTEESSKVFSEDLVNKTKAAQLAQINFAAEKSLIELKHREASGGAKVTQQEKDVIEAQRILDIKKATGEAQKLIDEQNRKTEDLRLQALSRQVAATAELKQVEQDLQQSKLNFLVSQGLLEANILIARQEEIDLAREDIILAEGIAQAQLAVQAMRNEGKLSEAQITAEYVRQVEVLTAQNAAKTQGIKLAAQASTELERQRTLMQDMAMLTETMAVAFGKVGKAIGTSLSTAVEMQENDEKYAKSKAELMKDEKKNSVAIANLDSKHTIDQINGISKIAGSTKDMFAEKTAAHKAFAALERVTAAMSMALQAQKLAQTLASLPATIAGGVSKLFEQGGWAGFAGAAAFLAMMASLGAPSGSVSTPKISASSINGSNGGVLGGSDKVSTSLVDGITKLNENNYELLRHTRGKMYEALVSIKDNIGNFMAGVARSGVMASQTDTGSSSKLFGLMGSSTSITGSGLNISGSYAGGVTTAQAYETVKKQKKFAGFSYSSKSSTSVQELPESLRRDIEGIFASMGEALIAGADLFGSSVEQAKARLNSVAFNLSINTKGMSTDEIMKALEAKVGTELDRAISQVIPGFANIALKYQAVGESSLDFLVRASYTADNVMAGLESIGKTVILGRTTVAEFSLQLAKIMGGVDKFNEQTSFFAENFLSDAERLAPVQARVSKEMRELGLASVDTREEFKKVVQGLDLATVKGKQTYAALMDLAPAFAAVYKESEKILTVEEKLADLREKELTLKEKITQAYESESSAIKATIDSIKGSINSLVGYKSSLNTGANSTLTPAEKYALARSEAAKVAAAAASGDSAAASKLPSVLDNLLNTSKVMNASGGGYQADFDYVQRLLDMSIGGLEGQKTDAQKQLTTLENTYSTLNIMKEQSYTMVQLMQQLADLQTEEARIVTEQETNKRAEAELKALNEKAEALRRQQEAESREQILTLKQGFMGVVKALSPSTSNTTSSKQPIVNNPGYYIWNEPTGGA